LVDLRYPKHVPETLVSKTQKPIDKKKQPPRPQHLQKFKNSFEVKIYARPQVKITPCTACCECEKTVKHPDLSGLKEVRSPQQVNAFVKQEKKQAIVASSTHLNNII